MKTRRAQSQSASRLCNVPPPLIVPDDLIVEILSWPPVKSLLQFRCVCKSWNSSITDPNFVKLHLHKSSRNPSFLLVWQRIYHEVLAPYSMHSLLRNSSSTIDEDDCYPLIGFEFVGSCNGLVCLLGNSLQNGFSENCFYLCNPATKLTSKDLGHLPVNDNYYSVAFGYDNLGDTYKVLAFGYNHQAKEKSQKKTCENLQLGRQSLETSTQLLLPSIDEAPPFEPTIGVLTDYLCFSHDSNTTHFVVWQMKVFEVEKSWTQFMKVSYQDLQIEHYDLDYLLLPLCKSENGDILMMTTTINSQAILYHRSDNRVERIVLPKTTDWRQTMDYVESLVLPCCNRMLMTRHNNGLERSHQGSTE